MAEARTGKTKPMQPDGALMLGGEQVPLCAVHYREQNTGPEPAAFGLCLCLLCLPATCSSRNAPPNLPTALQMCTDLCTGDTFPTLLILRLQHCRTALADAQMLTRASTGTLTRSALQCWT